MSSKSFQNASKLNGIVSVLQFGAIGDGVADDTTALIAFFNSAIANAGIQHVLFKNTYAVSAVMPIINVSNVWISGAGSDMHDTGSSVITGTVIKWIGASNPSTPIVKISSISGASNARVSGVKFTGIGINCANGTSGYGLELSSVWDCDVDVTIVNAGNTGLTCNVVAALGEARDVQQCRIRLKSRQIEAPLGFGMVCTGSGTPNFSMNQVWLDARHKDRQALYLINSDNNDWMFFRAIQAPGGTATESVSCLGGVNSAERCRAERFFQFTSTVPLRAYGTDSYTVASEFINIYNLDRENGTPYPIINTGASVFWKNDSSALPDTPWKEYTPTLTVASGSLTTAVAYGSYIRRGNVVYIKISIAIPDNGTAAGWIKFTLPIPAIGNIGSLVSGKERGVTSNVVCGYIDGGGATDCMLQTYNGLYPGGTGYTIAVSGFYEVA